MVFYAYDIRGIYGKEIDERFAFRLAQAFYLTIGKEKPKFAIGKDVRIHSDSLEKAFYEALSKTDSEVYRIGTVPTPLLYFIIAHRDLDGGAMITASHNPPEWNGFKLCRDKAYIIAQGMGMEKLKEIFFSKMRPAERYGKTIYFKDEAIREYVNFISNRISLKREIKAAIDIGNGACFELAPIVMKTIGAKIRLINGEPNGLFPNRPPEPKEENLSLLKSVMRNERLDFGVAYDGDGDRAVFVDDLGRVVPGDVITAIFAKHFLKRSKGKIVVEVNFSKAIEEYIRSLGGEIVESRVGHAYIMDLVIKESALLGGEVSSHFYFLDIYGLDDAIYATAKMAELLSEEGVRLSELVNGVPRLPNSPVFVIDVPNSEKFKIIDEIASDFEKLGFKTSRIDGVKAFSRNGWVLVRASNTMPQIKFKAEGNSIEELDELIKLTRELIDKARNKVRKKV